MLKPKKEPLRYTQLYKAFQKQFKQFRILLRHFVVRLFNNDVMKYENQRTENLVIFLTFLAVFSGLISFVILWPYLKASLGFTSETVWIEKTFFFTLSMAVTGIISVLSWDNIFLDIKDHRSLSVLPINANTLYLSKIASLLVFVGILSLALHLAPLIYFTFFLGDMVNVNPFYHTSLVGYGLVHLVTSFIANLFVFLLVACVQGVLLLLLGTQGFKKVSLPVQSLLLIVFGSVFIWFPQLAPSLMSLRDHYSSLLYYFPPMWFVGFYEHMIGNYDFVFKQQFLIAAVSITVVFDIYILSIPLTFRRFFRHASVNGNGHTAKSSGVTRWIKEYLHSGWLKHPVQRGMFYFSLYTLNRSRKHKLQFSAAFAIPITFTITQVTLLAFTKGVSYLYQVKPLMVAIPFVMFLFLLLGFRIIVLRPVGTDAVWLFHMAQTSDSSHYVRGLVKLFYLIGIMPVSVLLFTFYLYFWGFLQAFLHTAAATVLGCFMLEAVFFGYSKIPFVSEYVPGKLKLKSFWFLYLAGIGLYVAFFTWLGTAMLRHLWLYLVYYILIIDGFFLLRRMKNKRAKHPPVLFEEEPQTGMLTLGLD